MPRIGQRRASWQLALRRSSALRAGGYNRVDFLYGTEGEISVAGSAERPLAFAYIVYYKVIALFAGLTVLVGRHAGCHTICWMAPFMMLGRWIRNRLAWPSLRLRADAHACTDCKSCTNACPMSLDVNAMVRAQAMENAECVLCGTCVDTCPATAIRYSFSWGKG